MPLSVLGWIQRWNILDVNANKKYNTVALMRWKQIFKLVFLAIAMTRHPAVAIIFHNGRRYGQEEILEKQAEAPAPRRLLPLGAMVKVELQEEMESNGLEFQGLGCREMRAILSEQRIENGQSRRGARAADPELRGLAKKSRAELAQLARKRNVKVTDDMLKDKIVCLLLGQTPKAVKKEKTKDEVPSSSISDMAMAAEDIGVEEDQTWEMIVPMGEEQEEVGRKRKMKPGQVEPYKDMIKKAVSFLTWQTTFLGTSPAKPLFSGGKAIVQDLCDVFNVKTDPSYDLMQIFAGEAVISEEFSRAGLKVCEPIDHIYNYNLRRDRPLLDFVEEIGMTQLNSKRDILFENPLTSEVFKQSQTKRLREHPRVQEVKVDMCQFNLRHQQSNGMVKKPTKPLVSNDSYVKRLSRQCDGRHQHHQLEGAHYTRKAGRYNREFAKAVLQAYQHSNMTYMMENGVYAIGDLMDLMGGESDDWFYYENVGDLTEIPVELPDGPDWSRVGRRRVVDLETDTVVQDFEKADITTDLIKPKLDRTPYIVSIADDSDQGATTNSSFAAIAEHWGEWKKFGPVEALSLEESQQARTENDSNRFLPSRFVFRDKNANIRAEANPVPVKAKARLCAGGHRDPDLQTGALRTDAPTVTRTSSLLSFIMAARFDWSPVCADIMSAFMQGEEQPRDKPLFMEQPPQGLPGLQPGQVLRIVKGIFGLATAPRQWWATLKNALLKVELVSKDGHKFHLVHGLVDPALFVGHGSDGTLQAIVCVHVDDLLIASSTQASYDRIKKLFPFGGWQGLDFTFCAKDVVQRPDGAIRMSQSVFAEKLEPLELTKERKRDLGCPATEIEIAENRSMIGSLGWLATQTRPDLAAGVSMAQRVQKSPTVADVIETTRIVPEAKRYNETAITIPKLQDELCILVFHDAAWANVDEPDDKVAGAAWWRRRRMRTAYASEAPKRLNAKSQAAPRLGMAAAGSRHTVLLRSDGSAVACGGNEDGQCDLPALTGALAYTQVAAGEWHTVLLRSDGSAVACGGNDDGQCDLPALTGALAYTQVRRLGRGLRPQRGRPVRPSRAHRGLGLHAGRRRRMAHRPAPERRLGRGLRPQRGRPVRPSRAHRGLGLHAGRRRRMAHRPAPERRLGRGLRPQR
ncbi:unnamed protein product [Prorocentrum cordatum]|uniref:Reverse transcriptase Ty1/copia-type domain-containing protein n=1 Tax=Prorocentrum cordatum TaxID=2364126 RepID=A0ABN9RJ19_9DINO|nr:unnamed protein product [Polarella glacialis]